MAADAAPAGARQVPHTASWPRRRNRWDVHALAERALTLTVYLLLIWAPASAPALHELGARPTATPTGRVNNQFLHSLLH